MREHFLSDTLRNAFFKFLNEKFKNNEIDFKQFVDTLKSIKDKDFDSCLHELLKNKELFEELIADNRLNKEDLKYLLNTIDDWYELSCLCLNTPLIKHILNELILNKELVDKFNKIIENWPWCKETEIHTLFELIEDSETHEWNSDAEEEEYYKKSEIDQELLELNELNKKVYLLNTFDLSIEQKLELDELIKNNEIALNRLIQIVDNHLESNYDFKSLMSCLKKTEKKTLLNI